MSERGLSYISVQQRLMQINDAVNLFNQSADKTEQAMRAFEQLAAGAKKLGKEWSEDKFNRQAQLARDKAGGARKKVQELEERIARGGRGQSGYRHRGFAGRRGRR